MLGLTRPILSTNFGLSMLVAIKTRGLILKQNGHTIHLRILFGSQLCPSGRPYQPPVKLRVRFWALMRRLRILELKTQARRSKRRFQTLARDRLDELLFDKLLFSHF